MSYDHYNNHLKGRHCHRQENQWVQRKFRQRGIGSRGSGKPNHRREMKLLGPENLLVLDAILFIVGLIGFLYIASIIHSTVL
ncbi:MAG: hypothetical protein WCS43_00295 [Verrucomicrobiota bacterium]